MMKFKRGQVLLWKNGGVTIEEVTYCERVPWSNRLHRVRSKDKCVFLAATENLKGVEEQLVFDWYKD